MKINTREFFKQILKDNFQEKPFSTFNRNVGLCGNLAVWIFDVASNGARWTNHPNGVYFNMERIAHKQIFKVVKDWSEFSGCSSYPIKGENGFTEEQIYDYILENHTCDFYDFNHPEEHVAHYNQKRLELVKRAITILNEPINVDF